MSVSVVASPRNHRFVRTGKGEPEGSPFAFRRRPVSQTFCSRQVRRQWKIAHGAKPNIGPDLWAYC